MRIGFIGYGEAAYELSSGLVEEGAQHLTAFDVMQTHEKYGQQIKERAKKAGVNLQESMKDVVSGADVVFVAVPANVNLKASKELAPLFSKNTLYVDVSASSPTIKEEIQQTLDQAGILYVDVALLGPLPVFKHKVSISASGSGVHQLIEKMKPYHMNITAVSDRAGEASAVKLIRSIFMKGIVGLHLETLQAANNWNVSEEVLHSISETMDSHSFLDTMNRLVTGSSIHAQRRAFELGSSIEMLQDAKLNAEMSIAAKHKLEELADLNIKELFHGSKPESWEEVIRAYSNK
ncbi:prephenate dehydrogenase/arogenate dehydrogenase family protein [Alkalicoccobacillus murimartini]|uniref:3-hydroxyisobutyrate dehydrogenase-like beta-hydroxyacid dehydrogenase n=1 Tax=Alkalicoccobacillus murimartini TaxID=171685 RepID=A0ABT9YGA6_9BACI|nr:prephenate dehydrogenase/arogenate dehydrogenase family protein [Alkalicoccobacillus murimartini]MDQ0206899.1 3-hydroxyisobutyrate dehydrogenase-like beta-hydroxyacid dehydrogenase [Alkalicoccobacillus murimartini]